uniref:ATP synthase complex subunit 8 n=1 Tax=Nilssonia nigricans TaxID=1078885 RepID=A0A3B1EHN3_9SAUR|nr:ATP synthase F0 subunit 8 [Nilssonia nigricans]AUZ97263.1 ATP synthase F0 subunit 8 [Nilssonia nigricans]
MPQLNPNPWLFILLITWSTYMTIYQPKIMSFLQMNNIIHNQKSLNTHPWNWPWI